MSKMNALEMLNLIILITHKKHCLISALSEHKLLIFKTLFLLYTQHKNGFSKFTEYIVEFFTNMGLRYRNQYSQLPTSKR